MPPHKTTTLLIEDSGFMRIILSDLLKSDPSIELLGTASNGLKGLEKIRQLRPDVIITDMVMPESDGLAVVKNVMQNNPKPVILLSSLEKEDPKVFEALLAGAFDFLNKEEVTKLAKQQQFPLNEMVKVAAGVSLGKLAGARGEKNTFEHSFDEQLRYEAIAIGASTGGPVAIEQLLNGLPANLNIPVIIAQHMPEQFLRSFAKRLDRVIPLRVKLAQQGEEPEGGTVYVLPGHKNSHVILDSHTNRPIFSFTRKKYREFNFPSIDGLFMSLAEVYGKKLIGIVLTGMGRDGTKGLQAIQQQRGFTIAQDEKSSVVFGMPKSAIDHKVINQVLALKEIPGFVVSCLA
ncbi:chemotaxis-specific protein-glutamate methyltransferase CheB [Tunicatimonas pelagia]|uniref:chemotaxis-specific protein-glutamate methyltransferase CheB n=1 Tax=Tunicatimonas pelagia TaxID=931531 RepID=UPI0026659C86|nr:chemotaxis-specific protein-glutamate methyltransferase CheB [Tunicatimonas pelagia]WKN41382.1 chemotaxis-specific protein-glutamate methyltransferase CheB [Tunicatimonas pelagia]